MLKKQRYVSILNDVLGPIMRGPSSSHTAGPHAIANICRQLSLSNGEKLQKACIRFDSDGSFAQVYTGQGSDEGFAAGLIGIEMESDEYANALSILRSSTPPFEFNIEICSIKQVDHPNLVEILLTCVTDSIERTDKYLAISSGGGTFEILQCNKRQVGINGATYVIMIECSTPISFEEVLECFTGKILLCDGPQDVDEVNDFWLLRACRELNAKEWDSLTQTPGIALVREAKPIQLLISEGEIVFNSSKNILELCKNRSLPEVAVHYEAQLSGLTARTVDEHFVRRAEFMLKIVEEGLARNQEKVQYELLKPTSGRLLQSQAAKDLAGNSMHIAISAALSVMETNAMRGIVCACPTAGSAGIIPGCLYSLKQTGHSISTITDVLKVAGMFGAIIGIRATFAAELAGCMVETGAAAAMAAAGLAHAMDGSPETVINASAIALINTLGLICDPVGGGIEVPCYARNMAGVGHAFVAASTSIGGFKSFVPFDEVVDILLDIGKCMPSELRCTSLGGLAATPTAMKTC